MLFSTAENALYKISTLLKGHFTIDKKRSCICKAGGMVYCLDDSSCGMFFCLRNPYQGASFRNSVLCRHVMVHIHIFRGCGGSLVPYRGCGGSLVPYRGCGG